jgi:MoxR-like ATPase
MEAVREFVTHVREQVGGVVVGQQETLNQCMLAVLCKGHVLIEGVPGIAKTLMAKTLARVLGLDFQRVQCTSDLMPADILGTNILNMASSAFQLHKGPVFTDVLLVDEINRMPPRTQAALLECMEERQVTLDGARHPLSEFFTVFATQNPVEFEGTYPLPEAQLDRFLLKVRVDYLSRQDEILLLTKLQQGVDLFDLSKAEVQTVEPSLLKRAREEVRTAVRVEPSLFAYIVEVTRQTRTSPALSLGASPRATISLMATAKAAAAMEGRDYIIPDDVKSVAVPVLRHRVILKPEAELEGLTSDHVLSDLLRVVEVPK